MATCDEIRGVLAEYIEEALPANEHSAIGQHLEVCAGCRHELDELQAVTTLLRYWTPPSPPSDLWAGVAARIGGDGPSEGGEGGVFPPPWLSWKLLVIIGVVVAGGTGLFVTRLRAQGAFEPLPRYQESLSQANELSQAGSAFSDPSRRMQPVLQRERGGAAICH